MTYNDFKYVMATKAVGPGKARRFRPVFLFSPGPNMLAHRRPAADLGLESELQPAPSSGAVVQESLAAMRADPVARLTLAWIAVLVLPHLLPVVSAEWRGVVTEYLAETVLALLVVVAVRCCFNSIASARERRFWDLITIAAGLTLVTELTRLVLSDEWWSRLPLFTTDVVALLSYFLIFGAVEFKPHGRDGTSLRRKIEIAASMTFALATCVYLLAIPAFAEADYDAFAPAMFTFTVLDFVLAFRAWSIARRCSSRRWRAIYWWLGTSFGVWGGLDLAESLIYSGVLPDFPPGTPLDLAWYLPYVAMIAFALVKHQPALISGEHRVETQGEIGVPVPRMPAPLVGYALGFFLLHLTIGGLNLFGRRSGFAENAFTFTVVLVLAGMAWVQQSLLAGEHKRALAEARAARDAAEAASRAKLQFLASMSHEVRTPINGVLGMLELLTRTELSQRQAGFVSTARQAGRHLLHVINGVLDISKIEAGKLVLESHEFDLPEAVEETVHIFAEDASAKGLELVCDIGEIVPQRVIGDESRLRQVLANLIGNAVKFTDSGHVVVTVEGNGDEQVALRFSVRDTGIGIAKAEQERLFEAFTQADDSVTRKYGGTGLGLAIARQLCEAMGGQIGVNSRADHGSEFWFTVVLEAAHGVDGDRADLARLQGARVLVVGGRGIGREVLEKQLRSWRIECVGVSDEGSARALLAEAGERGRPFAASIIMNAGGAGRAIDLARRIEADPRTQSCPLILAIDVRGFGSEALDGFCCLPTPLRRSQLLAALSATGDARYRSPARELPATVASSEQTTLANHVLLVEDNAVNVEVAVATLESFGCRVEVCTDGGEALEALDRSAYDVILMDCQMPHVDGYEATRLIRSRRDGRERIPIIALTAHAFSDERQKCFAAGMDDYVAKPFDQDVLYAAVQRWSGRSSTYASQPGVETRESLVAD